MILVLPKNTKKLQILITPVFGFLSFQFTEALKEKN